MAEKKPPRETGSSGAQTSGMQAPGGIQTAGNQSKMQASKPMEAASSVGSRAYGIWRRMSDAIPEDFERTLDTRLSRLSPAGFLGVAAVAMGTSAVLAIANERKGWANFVGNWVPALLFLTLYTKIVKLEESIAQQRAPLH